MSYSSRIVVCRKSADRENWPDLPNLAGAVLIGQRGSSPFYIWDVLVDDALLSDLPANVTAVGGELTGDWNAVRATAWADNVLESLVQRTVGADIVALRVKQKDVQAGDTVITSEVLPNAWA